jgi:predicted kinase
MGNYFVKQEKTLVIIRGLPGSGKTTMANNIKNSKPLGYAMIISLDDYFTHDNYYIFDPRKLNDAHIFTQKRTEEAMKDNINMIILDNNNVRMWECKIYVNLALKYGYQIVILETDTPWRFDTEILLEKTNKASNIKYMNRLKRRWEEDFTVENILKSKEPWNMKET